VPTTHLLAALVPLLLQICPAVPPWLQLPVVAVTPLELHWDLARLPDWLQLPVSIPPELQSP
jgi:hypothetical protein